MISERHYLYHPHKQDYACALVALFEMKRPLAGGGAGGGNK